MSRINFIEVAARKKLGQPEEWKARKFESVGDLWDCLVTGCIPSGEYRSGQRKGKPKFIGPYQSCVVNSADVKKEENDYQESTGRCSTCCGEGTVVSGWSVSEGIKTKPCTRCNETGVAI